MRLDFTVYVTDPKQLAVLNAWCDAAEARHVAEAQRLLNSTIINTASIEDMDRFAGLKPTEN